MAPSRMRRGQQGLEELRKHVDTIMTKPKLLKSNEKTLLSAFKLSNTLTWSSKYYGSYG